jgi:hypothetical protein
MIFNTLLGMLSLLTCIHQLKKHFLIALSNTGLVFGKNGQTINTKENLYIFVYKKLEQLIQEQKSEVKNNCLAQL